MLKGTGASQLLSNSTYMENAMNKKVKQTLDCIISRFKVGDIPEAVAFSMFPAANIPSADWSKLNRTIMFLAGTQDARGFRQWKKADRQVMKNSKAFYILVPNFKKTKDRETGEEKIKLLGFMTKPVFRLEDTDGEPLDYEQIGLPELPLTERAEEWGVSVRAVPGNYSYYGYYSSIRKEIGLASPDEVNFFHELAHCGHEKVVGDLKAGQNPLQEIVAELSAQALCRLVGKANKETLGNSYKYIEGYAKKMKLSVHTACLQVLSDTEKVLNLILKT
jgi:hypothetical protein